MISKIDLTNNKMVNKNLNKEKIIIGVDIGGTNTVIGIVDFNYNLLFEDSFPTLPHNGINTFVERLVTRINEVFSIYENSYSLEGIGVAAPGVNYLSNTIESPANLNWGNVDFIEIMKNYFHTPISLINDANAAALGEQNFGNAKGMKNFIVLTLGTGLGSGIIVDGNLLYGENGFAGEIGHTIIEINGRQCNCGRNGCLETYVSATGIKKTVFNLLCQENDKSELRNLNYEDLTSKQISEFAIHNDPIALKAFDYTAEILGKAMANMVAFFDPQAIILSGGLVNADNLLLEPTYKYFEKYLLNFYKGKVQILVSGFHNGEAAVLGACSFALKSIINAQIDHNIVIDND